MQTYKNLDVMAQKLQELISFFDMARAAGLCSSQKEFAALVGVAESTMSMAMNGAERALTDSLIGKARMVLLKNNALHSPSVDAHGASAPVAASAAGSVSAVNGRGQQKILGTPSDDVRHIVDRFIDEVAAQRLLTQQAMDQVSSLVQTISNLSNSLKS